MAPTWSNSRTAFAVGALILLSVTFVMLIVRLVIWPWRPAHFNKYPHAGRPQQVRVPVVGGAPEQMALVQQPGQPSSLWHWSTRPCTRVIMNVLQGLTSILFLSALSANTWTWSGGSSASAPFLYFGVFNYRAGSYTISYATLCKGQAYGCSTFRAAAALTFIFGLVGLFCAATLLVKMCAMCCAPIGNPWVEWMPRVARMQLLCFGACIFIWSIVAHVVLLQQDSSLVLSSSWSITLVCFLFSVALLIWYEQHTEHRPDGGELAYIPGANLAQPQRVIIVQQQQQPPQQGQFQQQQAQMPLPNFGQSLQQPPQQAYAGQPQMMQPPQMYYMPQQGQGMQAYPVYQPGQQFAPQGAPPAYSDHFTYSQQYAEGQPQPPPQMVQMQPHPFAVYAQPVHLMAQPVQPQPLGMQPVSAASPQQAQLQQQPPVEGTAAAAAAEMGSPGGWDPVIKPPPPPQ
jgi:hypothetical protein